MENKNVKVEAEGLTVWQKVSEQAIRDLRLDIDRNLDDFVKKTMTMKLTGTIHSNLAEERDLEYYFDRPTFLDWLLRRKRKATFKLKVKDLALNPPNIENSLRTYWIDKDYML